MAEAAADFELAEEDRLRAQWYALLGAVLAGPPDRDRLASLAALAGDESDLGQGVSLLAAGAAAADPKKVAEEFFGLFIGVGRGELIPYGSYYLAGFLYEKPLANVRRDMRRLGIARVERVKEPEDHIAALMEMMSGLITGAFARPADLATQRQFFEAHVGSWAPRFFEDLENTSAAAFYGPVGRIGRIFMGIEAQGFEMAA